MSADGPYTAIMLEEIRDQNKVVIKAVGQIQDTILTLATKNELHDIAHGVKTIKAAVTSTNRDVADLDTRVTRLKRVSLSTL